MSDDRLGWIFDSKAGELESHYDEWAATYDADHDEWGWQGPEMVAQAVLRVGALSSDQSIYDAGCGTGKAGIALRRAGWTGGVVGLDFSQGMLNVAAESGAYDELIRCSLLKLPLVAGVAGAIVSSGVFTHGHVGGEAFSELARITASAGVVSLTQRVDIEDEYRPSSDALIADGCWELAERPQSAPLHPGRDETEQRVVSWRVLG